MVGTVRGLAYRDLGPARLATATRTVPLNWIPRMKKDARSVLSSLRVPGDQSRITDERRWEKHKPGIWKRQDCL
jgi:hypothetical protein